MSTANVSISADGLTVRKSDGNLSNGTAFFSRGVTSGFHTWKLRVSLGRSPRYRLGAGVVPRLEGEKIEVNPNNMYDDYPYFTSVTFTNKFDYEDGDTFVLHFNCQSRAVCGQIWRQRRLRKQRHCSAKERKRRSERFFPFVYMRGPNDAFTILSWSASSRID